jgi:hypothetical protein
MTAIIVPTMVALVPLLITLINKKTEELRANNQYKDLNKYITLGEDAICTAVVAVTQSYVDALKKTGEWNDETKQVAFIEARNQAILIMSQATKDAIAAAYGDLNAWIDNKVEFYVSKTKTIPPTQ